MLQRMGSQAAKHELDHALKIKSNKYGKLEPIEHDCGPLRRARFWAALGYTKKKIKYITVACASTVGQSDFRASDNQTHCQEPNECCNLADLQPASSQAASIKPASGASAQQGSKPAHPAASQPASQPANKLVNKPASQEDTQLRSKPESNQPPGSLG